MTRGSGVLGTLFPYSTVRIPGCTGSIIGPRHILTAAHCVSRPGQDVTFYATNGKNTTSTAKIVKVYMDGLQFSDKTNDCPVDHRGYVDDWEVLYIDRDIPSTNMVARMADTLLPVGSRAYQVGWLNNVMVWNLVNTIASDPNGCPSPHPPAGQYCHGSVRVGGYETGGDSGGPLFTSSATGPLTVHGDLLVGVYTSTAEYLEKILWATGMVFSPGRTLSGTIYSQVTTGDWRACATLCQADGNGCVGYEYAQSGSTCRLFSVVRANAPDSSVTSGRKTATGACSGDICPLSACQAGIGTGAACGGGNCPQCSNGLPCTQNSDCITNSCQNGTCVGGPAPSSPPAIFYGYDTDRRGCTNCDWNWGHWKATCGSSEAALGLSKSNDNTFTHALLCKNVGSGASGDDKRLLTFDPRSPGEIRADKRINVDPNWDNTSSYKLECGLNEYVSGVSQKPDFYPPHTHFSFVRCSSGLGSAAGCQKRLIQDGGYSGAWGDWDYSYRKADCPSGKVMVGISVDHTRLRPNSILCCDQGTTTRYEAEASSGVWIPGGNYVFGYDNQASKGVFEKPINSDPGATSLSWMRVESSATANRTLEFAVRSTGGADLKMGVKVNGSKVGVIHTASTDWQIVSVSAQLNRSSATRKNIVTLTNSEGTNPLQLDYMQITVP